MCESEKEMRRGRWPDKSCTKDSGCSAKPRETQRKTTNKTKEGVCNTFEQAGRDAYNGSMAWFSVKGSIERLRSQRPSH